MASNLTASTTKSIDVGSMFLMDLSVHESELSELSDAVIMDNEHVFPSADTYAPKPVTNFYKYNENKRSNYVNPSLSTLNRVHQLKNETQQQTHENICNSLDRIAHAIYTDESNSKDLVSRGSLVTIVEPQPLPDVIDKSSVSLSDESFVTGGSSGASSISGAGNSLCSSYTATSDADDEERGSTTAREDSGVLDMKDLDSQLNNSYDNKHDVKTCLQNQRLQQERPISDDITATNLISKSIIKHNSINSSNRQATGNRYNKPTNSNHHHHHHPHDHNQRNQSSKRSMSASLPIQVPSSQMKMNLNKLKLYLIRDGSDGTVATNSNMGTSPINAREKDLGKSSTHPSSCAFHNGKHCVDEFDDFLEQEYNDNHQNHYPTDKYDEEHLRAGENPMKLFESIQALARSLHEDAELFGSLPPKRMLESPIRSLALV